VKTETDSNDAMELKTEADSNEHRPSTYFDMNVWSRLFAVSVPSISTQQLNWYVISWYTYTSFVELALLNVGLARFLEPEPEPRFLTRTEENLNPNFPQCEIRFSHGF